MECHFPSLFPSLSAKMIFSFFIRRKKAFCLPTAAASEAFDNLMPLL